MEPLVQLVSEKTGLSPEKSKLAVETVLQYVRGRLPPTLQPHFEQLLRDGQDGFQADDLMKALGGLLGGGK